VNLAAPRWAADAFQLLERGYLLLIDYGDPAPELYGAAHPQGTLRCYYQHTMSQDPLLHIGHQDITAHVDFSAVTRASLAAGWSLVGATRQQALLGRLGLGSLAQRAGQLPLPVRRAHQAALRLLGDENGLGRLMAIAFGKDAPAGNLSGFARRTGLAHVVPEPWWRLGDLDPWLVIRAAQKNASGTPLSAREIEISSVTVSSKG
jgi:SAM-dependent MidA family methyltransferase